MIQLLVTAKASGQIWDATPAITVVTWETNRTGSPGVVKFTMLASSTMVFQEGDFVALSFDGQLQFTGFVFTKTQDRWGVMQVTCYDRIRYLKANASYAFFGQSAAQIITQIAADFQLTTGTLADTGFLIPSLIEEDQCCIDIIGAAVQQTLLGTGDIYVFYDNGIGLSLQRPEDMTNPTLIGSGSLLMDFSYKTDIDAQTYNSVKLARPNEATGRADTFVALDSNTITQWGLLQKYQTIDGAVNDAQAIAQAEATLSYYNRRLKSLSFSSLGVPGLRAGQMLLVQIPVVGEPSLNQYIMIERVTHTWEQSTHTMEVDCFSLI